jgi:protein-disulfide isomerase
MATKEKDNTLVLSKHLWIGEVDAPVKLVEYGDYQSEACARAHGLIKDILLEHEGKIRYNFRHFPLSQVHQFAMKAAEAAVAAAQEGKFWEMHDKLFENRRHLGTISLKGYAREIGITNKRFLDNLVNSTFSWQVRDDLLEGLHKGVREVPAFFINGELFTGKLTLKELSEHINKAAQQNA